jgi:plasmid stabilization system protein ParE
LRLHWTGKAISDLSRLHEFLAEKNPAAAARAVQALARAPERLKEFPRLGARLEQLDGEVRRLIVANYEIRYELKDEITYILGIWHGREDR